MLTQNVCSGSVAAVDDIRNHIRAWKRLAERWLHGHHIANVEHDQIASNQPVAGCVTVSVFVAVVSGMSAGVESPRK